MAKIVRNGLLYGSSDSADITYDNTSSGMTASTVQGAVDEVNTNVGDLTTLDTTDKTSAVGAINELNRNLSNKADKTMLSNRNLLDNPFFTVNSRGKTEYTGEVYTVDRWILQDVSGEAKLVVNSDNSLTITTVNNDGLKQVLNKLELNKTYTISFNDGTKIWTSTFVWEGTDIIKLYDDAVTVNYAIIAQENYDSIYPYVRYSTKANGKIVSVKLELGSVSTLANDVAPNYAEEVMKCSCSTADAYDTYANKPDYANLCSNFQDGVDTIYNSVVTAGATPTTKSPVDIATAISTLNSNLVTSTLLWTNSTPASNFNAQTINIDLTNYENVIVDFCYSTTRITMGSRVILSKNERADGFGCGIFENSIAVSRNLKITDNSILFGDGYRGSTKSNHILIPYKVYGLINNLLN